jgi:hypothetical protein
MPSFTVSPIVLEKGSGGDGTTTQSLTFSNKVGDFETKSIGGATNTLGTNWTGADIKAANLRLRLATVTQGEVDPAQTIQIDCVMVTVWYVMPPPQEPKRIILALPRQFVQATKNRFFIFPSKAK